MSNLPTCGAGELVEGQAAPETSVNEIGRHLDALIWGGVIEDRDLATPPGTSSDGGSWLVAASPTGAWAGQAGKLATAVGTNASNGWQFITVAKEGIHLYVKDEDKEILYDGSAWIDSPRTAANSDVWAGSSTTKFINPSVLYTASAPVALTSGTTITPDGNNGFNFTLTLAHNATLANPSNFKVGQSGYIEITQDGTGSRTLAYGSNWKFPGGAPVLSTAAGTVDLLTYAVVTSGRFACNLTKAYSS